MYNRPMKSLGISVHVVADYLCWQFIKNEENISVAKLHKLLYFTQAICLSSYGKAIFDDEILAWSHGPTIKAIEDRFKDLVKTLPIELEHLDIEKAKELPKHIRTHIIDILNNYGEFTLIKLEEYIQERETPYIEARKGAGSIERTNDVITKESMAKFSQRTNIIG